MLVVAGPPTQAGPPPRLPPPQAANPVRAQRAAAAADLDEHLAAGRTRARTRARSVNGFVMTQEL